MSLTHRSMAAAAWSLGSVLTQACLQLTVMAVLARHIPPEDFGLYAIVSMALGMVAMFSEIGVRPAVVQHKDVCGRYVGMAFMLSLGLGGLAMALTWIAAPWVAAFFGQPQVTGLLRATSVTLLISGYAAVAMALFERELHYRKLALIDVASYTAGFGLVGIGLALRGAGVWAIVAATVSQSLMRALLLATTSRPIVRPKWSWRDLRDLVRFGAGLSAAQLFGYGASQADNAAVGRLIGPEALGLYQMAFTIMDLPRRFLGIVVDQVMYAAMTRVQDDMARLRTGYLQSLEVTTVVLLPVTVLAVVVAPEAVRGLLGERWSGAVLPAQILLTQVPLRASVRLSDSLGGAVGRVYRLAATKMLYALMVGVGAVAGARWGLEGVATAVTLVTVANWLIMVRLALQILQIPARDYWRAWLPGCLLSIVALVGAWPSITLMRLSASPEVLRLGVTAATMACALFAVVWLWPQVLGSAALRLGLELAKSAPLPERLSGYLQGVLDRGAHHCAKTPTRG
ncbi:MAG TPA: lipopolysaccharide biosynthesis protein [Anaerolineae bacterium]|nr:lipopolysaccharide biosynthesis protein [Anaerolineae bacterium]HOQ99411.1 lipopolysaccharide biosynthesis protein [Anaerolineae bacterium]HPL27238.1 lipopolysaccharide biosynthesis protein [Anaerolineae bacterium]